MEKFLGRLAKLRYRVVPGVAASTTLLVIIMLAYAGQVLAQQGHADQTKQWDKDYSRAESIYSIPDIGLRDQHNKEVRLQTLLDGQRPVVLQFIFTSCETVCPMLTAMTSQAQGQLRELDSNTRIISISIDPDHDTPPKLAQYASQFDAQGDWYFLTGTATDIGKVLRAFHAMYAGDNKMNHRPYTFMRAAETDIWIRLIGLMGAKSLIAEYREVVK